MTNYVRCKECGNESQKEDSFLEISLVMRPFGSKEVLSSVGESLDYCLKPETLEGDNQYFCDKCQKKVDAMKGCKFSKLPYLLCFQLKRFDYDFSTFTRVKLNGEMRFPLLLDMNGYMARGMDTGGGEEDKEADGGDAVSSTAGEPEGKSCEEPSASGGLDEGKAEAGIPPLPDLVDAEGNKSPEQAKEEEVAAMGEEERSFEATWQTAQVLEEKGQDMYELYGVLIHSGSALGGHYYAYIRHLEDGQWYSFNDSTVTRIDVETVKRAWGGQWAAGTAAAGAAAAKRPLFKGTGYSGANAYMLMYRRLEPSRNARFPTDEEVPAHVREGVGKDEERAAKEKEEQDERQNALTLRVGTVPGQDGVQVVVSRKDTLAVVREKVWKALKLDQTLPLDCLRLREYADASFNAQVRLHSLVDRL
jgi:ubiquitin carboxyl-terminal hydrolase 47